LPNAFPRKIAFASIGTRRNPSNDAFSRSIRKDSPSASTLENKIASQK